MACRDVEAVKQTACFYSNFLKIHQKHKNQMGAVYSGKKTDSVGMRFTMPLATRLSMDMAMILRYRHSGNTNHIPKNRLKVIALLAPDFCK
jgi:hypothetical protein